VERSAVPGAQVVTLAGEIDMAVGEIVAGAFREVVDDGDGPVLVDLASVSFIDSTSLKLLLNLLRRLTRAGRKLALVAPSPHVKRLLDLTALSYTFAIYDGMEEAVAACVPGEG